MRYVPAPALAPGVVYRGVVVGWINDPLWILRPADGPIEDRRPRSAADAVPRPFTVGPDDLVVANAKLRPVLVVSGWLEIRAGGGLRVIPIHRRAEKPFYEREWARIVAGALRAWFTCQMVDPTTTSTKACST